MKLETTPCRSCGEEIVFIKTAAGKVMPVDAYSVEVGDTQFDKDRHVSHFSTCKYAKEHRRK